MERGDEEGRGRADIIVCEAYLHLQTPDSSYFFVRTMCYLLKAVKKVREGEQEERSNGGDARKKVASTGREKERGGR